ncbi:MAG: PhnD/SsuA/transferrin family substrate-binding protein [Planctomyces sp.]|nr:PhnD/SsuA/transferrin family substrate-binding protein [Planctomyces sp.]
MRRILSCCLLAAVVALAGLLADSGIRADQSNSPEPIVVVVMDPMSAPLSCDCVKGYAQRKYEHLGAFLQKQLGRPVKVHWSESLETALKDKTDGKVSIVIGKHSVALSDAKLVDVKLAPIASLTDKSGKSTQTGLIVVRKDDAAQGPGDLAGYRIFFGPQDCDEKSAAPMAMLKEQGVALPEKPEIYGSCTDATSALMELKPDVKAAAVISSYAAPLLEGCGTIQKGDLRVVAESDAVPFITAFVNESLGADDRQAIQQALLEVGTHVDLLLALETKTGFEAWKDDADSTVAKKKN